MLVLVNLGDYFMDMNKKRLFVASMPVSRFYKDIDGAHVFSKDLSGNYLLANDNKAEVYGLPSHKIIGKNDKDFFEELDVKQLQANDKIAIMNPSTQIFLETITHPISSLKKCTYLSFKTKIQDNVNNIIGSFGIAFHLKNNNLAEITKIINTFNLIPPMPIMMLPDTTNFCNKPLTQREKQCAYFLTRGMSAKEIATILNISPKTIETYIANMKLKLGCYKRSQLIGKILDYGLVL